MNEMSARLDRFTTGDLPREEERALARAALDDPQLFDALMTAGATRAALDREGTLDHVLGGAHAGASPRRFWQAPVRAAAFALAAALLIFAVVFPRARNQSRSVAAQAAVFPATSPAAVAPVVLPDPVVITAGLEDLAAGASTEFRSARTLSRAPRTEGRVSVAPAGGEIDVALGSLDGITHGTELRIVRGNTRRDPVGRLTITAVFREQSRAHADARVNVRDGDVALVPSSVVVAALHQRMVALVAAGDFTEAREAGARALPLIDEPGVAVADKRGVLALVGAMERRAGQSSQAVLHLRAAADLQSRAPAAPATVRAAVLNDLGASLLDVRRVDEAERAFAAAQPISSGLMKSRVENNRGAAAVLRGDRTAAERWYRSALSDATASSASADDRRVIEKNLSDLTTVR